MSNDTPSNNPSSNNPWEMPVQGEAPKQPASPAPGQWNAQPPANPGWGTQPQAPQSQHQAPQAQAPVGQQAWGTQPQGSGAAPTPQPGVDASVRDQGKGLVGSLFDFSFRHFATPHIARIVYMLATALLALGALVWIIMGIYTMASDDGSVLGGLLMLVVTPLVFLIYLAMLRMSMEMSVAVTRLADDVGRLRAELRERG